MIEFKTVLFVYLIHHLSVVDEHVVFVALLSNELVEFLGLSFVDYEVLFFAIIFDLPLA